MGVWLVQAMQSKSVSQDEVVSYVRDLQASDPDYHPPDDVGSILRCAPCPPPPPPHHHCLGQGIASGLALC